MIANHLRPFLLILLTAFVLTSLTACPGGGSSDDEACEDNAFGDCGGDGDGDGDGDIDTEVFRIGHFNSSNEFVEGVIGAGSTTVNGGQSTNLNVAIVDEDGNPAIDQSGTVQFGSICAGQGLAEIDPLSQSLSSGGAVVQYTALNCSPSDTVFATSQVDGQTLQASVNLATTPCSGPCTGGQDGLPGGSVIVLTSAPQLPSAADTEAEAITVTAVVRDSNNVARPNIPVNLSATSGVLILSSGSVETDNSGIVEAKLHTGGDPSIRDITVFASVSGAGSDSAVVNVVGTSLALDGPTAASDGLDVSYTATLTNSAGEAISGQTLSVTQNLGTGPSSVTTNSSGQATININVDGSGAATRTVSVSSGLIPNPTSLTVSIAPATLSFVSPTPAVNTELDISDTQAFRARLLGAGGAAIANCDIVFSTTRGNFGGNTVTTDATNASGDADATLSTGNVSGFATIQASTTSSNVDGDCPTPTPISVSRVVEIVAITPTSVNVQANPSTLPVNSTSSISAVVRDANNNPVKNQIVNFTIENYPSGSLSSASAVTGSDGIARVTFNSGNATSSTNGVTVRAKVGTTSIEDTVALTVGGQAVRVSLGFGRELIDPDDDTTSYQLPVFVSVTDPASNPAGGATVNIKLRATAYQKGHYIAGAEFWIPQYHAPTIQSPVNSQEPAFGCLNEDRNENGILDGKTGGNNNGNGTDDGAAAGADGNLQIPGNTVVGEDINDNMILDPQNPATAPSVVTMGEDGTNEFFVTYPKDHGSWLQVRIEATTQVGGTEGVATSFATLNITAEDAELDVAPPGVLRAICDFDGDVPGDLDYRTELGECDEGGVADTNPAVAVIGSPYGEIGSCQFAN